MAFVLIGLIAILPYISIINGKAALVGSEKSDTFQISGGNSTTISQYPYAVSISLDGQVIGAGAILNKNWVITSARLGLLGSPDEISVRIGSDKALSGGYSTQIARWVNHPQFNESFQYDVALIKLNDSIPKNSTAKPIKYNTKLPKDGVSANVTGWGWDQTEIQSANPLISSAVVPVLGYKNCTNYYPNLEAFSKYSFCTNGDGSGPCENDLGAPLVYKNKLIGTFSAAFICGRSDYPSIYADITKITKWIKTIIKT